MSTRPYSVWGKYIFEPNGDCSTKKKKVSLPYRFNSSKTIPARGISAFRNRWKGINEDPVGFLIVLTIA